MTRDGLHPIPTRSPKSKRLRIAFVVQRYGLEVNGGSETLCRVVAERLARFHDVEILTTRAVDYVTWRDEYPEGLSDVHGISVRRFSVDHPRDAREFDAISSIVFGGSHTMADELDWMKKQGPYSSPLLQYLAANRGHYDVFVFFTYLYCTTYFGLPLVKDRALLVPTCHDEPPIYLGIFDNLFRQVRHLTFLTPEERSFVKRRFYDCRIEGEITGIGIDAVRELSPDPCWNHLRELVGNSDFLLYVGRIDESKGCKTLIEHFTRYVGETGRHDLKLVLMGKPVMPIPHHPQLITTGFVDEATKLQAIAACRMMVAPSPYESLCIAILEAWMLKRPVLSNGDCKVLRGQCLRSGGGLWYHDYESFRESATVLLESGSLGDALGMQGFQFVQENCIWSQVEKKYMEIFSAIAGTTDRAATIDSRFAMAANR